jgi:hypothetical protein
MEKDMKKISILMALLFFLTPAISNAQKDVSIPSDASKKENSSEEELEESSTAFDEFFTIHAVQGALLFGEAELDVGSLNNSLTPNEYSRVKDEASSRGINLEAMNKYKFILGVSLQKVGINPPGRTDFDAEASTSYFLLNFGYEVLRLGNFRLFPLLGFGGGRFTMQILENGTPTIDEALSNPSRGTTLSTSYSVFNTGLGMDYLIDVSKLEDTASFNRLAITISLRGGYLHMGNTGDWIMDGEKLLDGPKIGVDGAYFMAGVGLGAFN